MKYLITGGAGFVGSHLCDALIKKGDEVICLDNFFTGNGENTKHLLANPAFRMVEADVEDPYDFEVDRIFNLACPAAPVWYQKDPVKTVRTSVSGAINVLELAKKRNCRVLQASTSEVYGDPKIHPQVESYWGNVNPIGPRACYDEGKRCAETLFFNYMSEYGVDAKVVRIFNTYGPRMNEDDGRVVSNFIVQALRQDDITVYGEGSQTRSFCFVDDMVRALILMMDKDGFAGPVNLGNPGEYTVKQLAEKIIALTGSKSKIVHKELPKDDPVKRKPDISLAKEKLGWEPGVGADEGLEKTIVYFEKHLKINTK